MTAPGAQPIDAAMAAALDRFDVPEASPGFVDRVAAMPRAGTALMAPLPRRRLFGDGRRGAWMRRATVGVIALGVASATAATTGFFPPIHIAVPARLIAMFTPAKAGAHVPHHPHVATTPSTELATAQPSVPVGATPSPLVAAAPPPAMGFIRHFMRREHQVDVVQARLAQQGQYVPRQVIDQQLDMREIAFGAAVRGDTQTKLPPAIAVMRDRAIAYLDAHPALRDQLRARAAGADAIEEQRRLARLQATQTAPVPPPISGDVAPSDAGAATTVAPPSTPSWAQRKLRAFRRQQRLREFWAAQQDPGPGLVPASPTPGEGNGAPPR